MTRAVTRQGRIEFVHPLVGVANGAGMQEAVVEATLDRNGLSKRNELAAFPGPACLDKGLRRSVGHNELVAVDLVDGP